MSIYDEITLANGLRIIGERIPHFRSVSVGLWIGAGSQYERAEENGLSHFLEHMMFKGTQRRSARQIAEEMDAVGGQMNAFTAKECTCYYAKVIDEDLPLAMDILSDVLLHSTFDERELEKEKGVILEEISMVEDSPEDLVHEMIMSARFGDQALARPILGPAKNVSGFSRADLMGYWKRMYRPETTVLALAGNYDWEQVKEMAGRFLGDWQPTGQGTPVCATLEAQAKALRKEKDTEQLHICLGFPGVSQDSPRLYPLTILNGIFGGAMSSRLFQKIREESGMAYSVYSYPSSYGDCGLMAVYAGTSLQHANKVVRMIREEIDRLLKEGVTQEEFSQARAQLKGSYILGLESTSSRMSAIGRRKLLMNNTKTQSQVIQEIEQVSFEDVRAVTQEILSAPCAAALVGKGADKVDLSAFNL